MNLIPLFLAIAMVESGNNPKAYNAKEQAAGAYQIRPIYVEDVNRILRDGVFELDDRYNKSLSEDMMRLYWNHYATEKRLGREPTYEDLARMHCSGPNGWKKKSTEGYWEKVKAELEKQE